MATPSSVSSTDKLTAFYYEALDFVEKNRTLVIGIAAAIVLGIAGIFFWGQYKSGQEGTAAEDLRKVMPLYQAGTFDKAISGDSTGTVGLKKIAEQYSGTPSGNMAAVYLGNSYFQKNEIDNALKAFKSVSSSSDLMSAAAIAGEAACYEQKKDFKSAANAYRGAAGRISNAALAPVYLADAARNFELAGDKDEAVKQLEQLKKDYPQASQARTADQSIVRLKS